MELAGRALLGTYEVDLLTDPYYAELYRSDRFSRSLRTPRPLTCRATTLPCRISSTPARSASSAASAPACRLSPCRVFFGGPITTTCCLVAIAFTTCWVIPYTAAELRPFLRPCLFLEDEPAPWPKEPGRRRVALALGGKYPARTYQQVAGSATLVDHDLALRPALPGVRPGGFAECTGRSAGSCGGARQPGLPGLLLTS